MSFLAYSAISYKDERESVAQGPALVAIGENGEFFIPTSFRGYISFHCAEHTVLAEYTLAEYGSEGAVERAFYQQFPPVAKREQSAGWLAPDGKFYPCRYFEHDRLAERLSRIYYGTDYGSEVLSRHEWLRIDASGALKGVVNFGYVHQAQIDAMSDLCFLDAKSAYARTMMPLLEAICEIQEVS